MSSLPTGTVTFLFTDIEGSTELLQRIGDRRYADILAVHRRLLRKAFAEGNGQEVDSQGDAFLVVFSRARDAVGTAVAAQRALAGHAWPDGASLRVRMGLHTGEPLRGRTGYVGIDVHRAARIAAAGHGGQVLLSDVTHGLVAKDLPEGISLRDLGEHRLKDLAHQPLHLFQLVTSGLPFDFPSLNTLDTLPNNLPRQLTSFVGRQREMAEVKQFLTTARLVTLTGTGGSGKTRLALQVAADILDLYPDGIWFVECGPVSDSALVPQAVASVVGVSEQPGRALTDALVDYVRPKSMLLILDNCEHLLTACARLSDVLLRACPNLGIMATSREGLGLAGELSYGVPALTLPDPKHLPPPEQLTLYEAVRLFVERATFAQPKFAVTANNAPAVVRVCTELDGIPLAIELAAARVRVLTVEQIAARLGERFRLLRGSPTALPRHQTLQAAMDWSYDLLSEKERVLLRRLSVFAGGWTLEAAETVCAGDGVEPSEILDLLARLVDRSLVVAATPEEEAWYRQTETVRQYSRDRLLDAGEVTAVRNRHRDWYLGFAEREDEGLRGPRQVVCLKQLDREHDNLRVALEWCRTDPGSAEAGLRLAGALFWFWHLRGFLREGREWLDGALANSEGASAAVRARALLGAGLLAWRMDEYDRASPLLDESLALFRDLGDDRGIGLALHFLAHLAESSGDFDRAVHLYEESLRHHRIGGDDWEMAGTLNCLGRATFRQGDTARAAGSLAESLRLYRRIGDRLHLGGPLRTLARIALAQGDYKGADALADQAVEQARSREESGSMSALQIKGDVALRQGDHERAGAFLRQSLAVRGAIWDREGIARSLERLAIVALARKRPERAARLFGAAEGLREVIGNPLPPVDRPEYEQHLAALRSGSDETALAAAWAEGRAMLVEDATAYGLAPDDPIPGSYQLG